MRKLVFLLQVLFIFLVLRSWPAKASEYTEVYHSGKIDWWKGSAEGLAVAQRRPHAAQSGGSKAKVSPSAEESARKNLLDLVGKVRVDSRLSIRDMMNESEGLRTEIRRLVEKAPVRRTRYRSDGGVEVVVRIALTGALAALVLPKEIQAIPPVLQPKVPAEKAEKSFSGLVVDCTGLKVMPAMAPRIVDEDGAMVYGPPHISREYAVKQGVAAYSKDLDLVKRDERVAWRPLILKAVRTAKTGLSDIVISNADAALVRGSASNLRSLRRCRVAIVLD